MKNPQLEYSQLVKTTSSLCGTLKQLELKVTLSPDNLKHPEQQLPQ